MQKQILLARLSHTIESEISSQVWSPYLSDKSRGDRIWTSLHHRPPGSKFACSVLIFRFCSGNRIDQTPPAASSKQQTLYRMENGRNGGEKSENHKYLRLHWLLLLTSFLCASLILFQNAFSVAVFALLSSSLSFMQIEQTANR